MIRKKLLTKIIIIGTLSIGIAGTAFFCLNTPSNKSVPNVIVTSNNLTKSTSTNAENDHKDTDIIPGSNLTYGGDKFSVPAEEVKTYLENKNSDSKKYVFLTFDDGPSPNTEAILNVLSQKDVHATFFVLGKSIEKSNTSSSVIKRCISEGNAIGNHSYSHDFKKLYPSNSVDSNTYLNEFNKTNSILKSILGNDFDTRVIRMPGGYCSRKYYKDPNLNVFDQTLSQNGITNIDWNALNGDAEGKNYSTDELLNNATSSSKDQNKVVILMHDTYGKEKTAQMLGDLIDYYKNNGYEFKTIKSSYLQS